MKRSIFIFVLFLVPVHASQLTIEDVKKEYAKIFQAEVHEHNGRRFDGKRTTKMGFIPF